MNNNDITGFIIDCLTDPGNRDKQAALNKWLEESEENQHLYAELKQLWEAAADVPPMPFNADEGWKELSQQMAPAARVKRLSPWRIVAAAAVLLFLIAGGWWWQTSRNAWITYATPTGDVDSITLPDGSMIHMKAGTSLAYRKLFKEREVKLLQGEAYFDVVKDPQRQFLVTADKSTVKVLGTAFNVRIENTFTEVIVFEGKISLHSGGKKLVLSSGSGNLATVSRNDDEIRHPIGNYSNQCAWATNELVFENEEAENVAKVLAAHYHISEIKVAENLRHKRITLRLHNTPQDEALEIFGAVLDQ
ncbi:FecR family protein [Chitinophaga filiformis]|uniref:Ferric-dicitrate binding protein FerR, regulates iron transport through sigma-19 n=1 Tax=Chitinophaga filiformis TaxID=104663 RepID=A0A1G8AI91_CHIFI|nr:FecR domain-containing protein [Chitinophaga filiformis]SDH20694.1 ferric-dicitrate binding protein FerR, regulates iron transport through sigma-19 [Chitinophaga filiformis]